MMNQMPMYDCADLPDLEVRVVRLLRATAYRRLARADIERIMEHDTGVHQDCRSALVTLLSHGYLLMEDTYAGVTLYSLTTWGKTCYLPALCTDLID